MTYLPEGLRSEMKGVSAEMRRKSSSRKSTPAERASLNAAQYASRLLNKMNDAEVWRGVKATLDVYDETAKTGRDGADAVVTLMRAVGERLAKK